MSRVDQVEASSKMITPDLSIEDPVSAYWFAQAVLRLRREVAWCWHHRMNQPPPQPEVLPPVTDAAADNLDLVRYKNEKNLFLAHDPAANYLTEEIGKLEPKAMKNSYWQRLVNNITLDEAGQFVLSLALASRLDAGLAPIFATCLNDLTRPFPTLALAQRLWDDPIAIIACADPDHPLYRYGLLHSFYESQGGHPWQRPLDMPSVLAQQLIVATKKLPQGVQLIDAQEERQLDQASELLVARLRTGRDRMKIVPLIGPQHSAFDVWAATLALRIKRGVVTIQSHLVEDKNSLLSLASICWLNDCDVLLPGQWVQTEKFKDYSELLVAAQAVPIRWYLPIYQPNQLKHLPSDLLTPPLKIDGLDFQQRAEKFKQGLGIQGAEMFSAIGECARRFRFQEQMITRVISTFADRTVPLTADNLAAACASEGIVELGNLAQLVTPRFKPEELVLPKTQTQQFFDILHAMKALTVVHHYWGTAKVWNESGISVLFCGSPGTGKTMAAEALADVLKLPMYRIDLSQVVNKYIGETEKNLKRIFDAAELSDCILFFDEADALFGKRTEVKDAHDRFANIEISYLLERMERFKGLAILATNRRKDLDEAFIRRLRYVIDFPVPGFEERKRIWQQVFPNNVDISELDLHYLSKQFQLSGGNIRSIAFNACLRAADADRPEKSARVSMTDVLMAIRRELEKMNRPCNEELFGNYGHVLKEKVA